MADISKIEGLLDQIIQRYSPGGEFGKPEEALLKRAKTKSLARTSQQLVSRGLAGTSAGAGMGKQWEEEIGMPARLELEDIRSGRLTEALGAKAGYLERSESQNQQIAFEEWRVRQQTPTLAERGLDAFGSPMRGTQAAANLKTAQAGGTGGTGGAVTHAGGGRYTVGGSSYTVGGGSGGTNWLGGNIGDISGGPRMDLDFVNQTAETVDPTSDEAFALFQRKNPFWFGNKAEWIRRGANPG